MSLGAADGMHVLFTVTNYPPHHGGVQQHVSALAKQLVRRGVSSSVVCLGEAPGVRDDDGVTVHTLRRRLDLGDVIALPQPVAWRDAVRALRCTGVTHISTHTRFFPMSWLGTRLGRQERIPVIHTEHGSDHVKTPSSVVNFGARGVDLTMGRYVLRSATEVLAVSGRVAEFVHQLSGRQAQVFGNGVDLLRWKPATEPVAQPRLVFVGRLVDEKGWLAFVNTVDRLRDVPGLHGVVAGDGPRRHALEDELRRRTLEDRVQVTGMIEHKELAGHLQGAIYVNPTRAAEGFQLTQLEALAAGARVVSYDVAGAAELRDIGAPVTVVSPGDEVSLIEAVRSELGHPRQPASDAVLAPWDWAALADRYIEVLGRTRGRPPLRDA